ncbi:hypothetical protein SAMN04487846_3439 [Microbacterium sp. cf046]|nr:hypothetical protein SAMN04487846_3439 [Microbacterium sp. cf046]
MNSVASLRSLNDELKSVGRLPRIFNAVVAILFLVVVWAGWVASGNVVMAVVFAVLPIAVAVCALPVKAWATEDSLFVRSYFSTFEFRFSEVITFIDLPYSGVWNRFSGVDGWLNLRLRMIEVALEDGRDVPLPATMSGARVGSRLADFLNSRVKDAPNG